jgi:hypothetical protein
MVFTPWRASLPVSHFSLPGPVFESKLVGWKLKSSRCWWSVFTGSRKFERLALPRITTDKYRPRSLGFLYPCGTEHQVAGRDYLFMLPHTWSSAPTLIPAWNINLPPPNNIFITFHECKKSSTFPSWPPVNGHLIIRGCSGPFNCPGFGITEGAAMSMGYFQCALPQQWKLGECWLPWFLSEHHSLASKNLFSPNSRQVLIYDHVRDHHICIG